ncbi:hypothetical protein D3C73_1568200 [compost metagenome]
MAGKRLTRLIPALGSTCTEARVDTKVVLLEVSVRMLVMKESSLAFKGTGYWAVSVAVSPIPRVGTVPVRPRRESDSTRLVSD